MSRTYVHCFLSKKLDTPWAQEWHEVMKLQNRAGGEAGTTVVYRTFQQEVQGATIVCIFPSTTSRATLFYLRLFRRIQGMHKIWNIGSSNQGPFLALACSTFMEIKSHTFTLRAPETINGTRTDTMWVGKFGPTVCNEFDSSADECPWCHYSGRSRLTLKVSLRIICLQLKWLTVQR